MASVRTYTIVYIALMVLGTSKVIFSEFKGAFEMVGIDPYWGSMGGILVLAVLKAGLIMGFYMHLREEPRSIAYVIGAGFFGVFLLTAAAGFSIQ